MKKETIVAPRSLEILLSHIFGREHYKDFMDEHPLSEWKKHLLKVVHAIRNAIVANIDTVDEYHKNNLLKLCIEAKEKIKKGKRKDEVNLSTIESLIKVIFLLVGRMPCHWNLKVVNRLDNWKLDEYRKLTYLQTTNHKVRLILSLPNSDRYRTSFSHDWELSHKLRYFNNDHDRFIKWFKQKYKDIYLEVF